MRWRPERYFVVVRVELCVRVGRVVVEAKAERAAELRAVMNRECPVSGRVRHRRRSMVRSCREYCPIEVPYQSSGA